MLCWNLSSMFALWSEPSLWCLRELEDEDVELHALRGEGRHAAALRNLRVHCPNAKTGRYKEDD